MNMISDICDRILASRGTDRWDGYVNMLKILKNAFSSERHWILEFLQNAEDARAERFGIRISDGGLLILNDGLPFEENDVRSICDVKSRKLIHLGFRGWLGVGFKSIFRVSPHVEIHSGDLHFAFDRQYWAARNWEGAPSGAEWPWEILPVECSPLQLPDGHTTGFWIPASESVIPILKRLAEFLGSDQFPSEMVLLLERVKAVEVQLLGGMLQIRKSLIQEKETVVDNVRLWAQEVLVDVTGERSLAPRSSESTYLVVRADVPVPEDVRSSPETEEIRRSQIPQREVGLVFGLTKDSDLRPVPSRLGGVYSFLPLEAEQTGLPFGLFGDFVPHPNRVAVNEGLLWNQWLCSEVVNLFQRCVEHVFRSQERWKLAPLRTFTWLLHPPASAAATRFWLERVAEPVKEFLAKGAFYPDRDGNLHRLADLVYVEEDLEAALGTEGMTAVLQGRHPADPVVAEELSSEIARVSLYDLIKEHHEVLKRLDPANIAGVYSLASDEDKLSRYYIGGRQGRDIPLDRASWVLGADEQLHRPNRVIHVALDLPSLPAFVTGIVRRIVTDAETTLHPDIVRNESAVRGLQRGGLRIVDKQDLVSEIKEQIAATHQRDDCPRDWDFPGDLICATLLVAKENSWYKPRRLVGEDGRLYDPNLLFAGGGPLDWAVAHSRDLLPGYSALHPGYQSDQVRAQLGLDLPTVRKWLKETGVHGFDATEDRALTERAGYSYAARHLEESEGHRIDYVSNRQQLGYDLQCSGHCSLVFEVKSMTEPRDISLEPSEVRAAEERGSAYILLPVYGLPVNPVLKRLEDLARLWQRSGSARIPVDAWLTHP